MEEYIIKTEYNNISPKCEYELCEEKPSFIRGKNIFRKYCIIHSNVGRKEWSTQNKTLNYGWKKGLTKNDHQGILTQSEKMRGENNPWFGKSLPANVLKAASLVRTEKLTLTNIQFIERAQKKYNNKYDYSLIEYTHSKNKIEIKCNLHNFLFFQKPNDHLSGYEGCPKCSPVGSSKEEKEIADYIKTFYSGQIIENDREQIKLKELDILIPEKNFAIEYNGLRWHTSDFIDKKKHLSKTQECTDKNIRLFHIFSDEWANKQDIVKSMIKYRLGFIDKKIAARKCEIVILDKKIGKEFFVKSHISGDNRANIYFGLKIKNEIVCCLSLKKPIQKKYGKVLEIARFANRINCSVQGGFQRLFKHSKEYAKNNGFESILTYADRRFGEGSVYLKAGFNFIGKTPLDYWYTDGHQREFRFKYRAQKPLTEKQVAENARCFTNLWMWLEYLYL